MFVLAIYVNLQPSAQHYGSSLQNTYLKSTQKNTKPCSLCSTREGESEGVINTEFWFILHTLVPSYYNLHSWNIMQSPASFDLCPKICTIALAHAKNKRGRTAEPNMQASLMWWFASELCTHASSSFLKVQTACGLGQFCSKHCISISTSCAASSFFLSLFVSPQCM